VRGFVEANRGRVSLESSSGGTSFVVEFPVEHAALAAEPSASPTVA
jgi:signal transduction histidine kinase